MPLAGTPFRPENVKEPAAAESASEYMQRLVNQLRAGAAPGSPGNPPQGSPPGALCEAAWDADQACAYMAGWSGFCPC